MNEFYQILARTRKNGVRNKQIKIVGIGSKDKLSDGLYVSLKGRFKKMNCPHQYAKLVATATNLLVS